MHTEWVGPQLHVPAKQIIGVCSTMHLIHPIKGLATITCTQRGNHRITSCIWFLLCPGVRRRCSRDIL